MEACPVDDTGEGATARASDTPASALQSAWARPARTKNPQLEKKISWKKRSHSWKKTPTPLESELEKMIQQLEKKMDLVFQLDRRMEKMIPQLEKR